MNDDIEYVINDMAEDLTRPDVGHILAIAAERKQKRQTAGKIGGAVVVAFLVAGVGLWATGRYDSGSTRLDTASGNMATTSEAADEVPSPTTGDPTAATDGTPADPVSVYDAFLSLPVAEAGSFAEMEGVEWRVVVIDGEVQVHTQEGRPDRLNFTVENGIVIAVQTDEEFYGVTFFDDASTTTTAPSAADIYLSLTVEEAGELADSRGKRWRVSHIDGVQQVLTLDLVPGRLNFRVEDGLVANVIAEQIPTAPTTTAAPTTTTTAPTTPTTAPTTTTTTTTTTTAPTTTTTTEVPPNPKSPESYISLTVEDAGNLATANGIEWRVVREDGVEFAVTADFVPGRLNFSVINGLVSSVEVETET